MVKEGSPNCSVSRRKEIARWKAAGFQRRTVCHCLQGRSPHRPHHSVAHARCDARQFPRPCSTRSRKAPCSCASSHRRGGENGRGTRKTSEGVLHGDSAKVPTPISLGKLQRRPKPLNYTRTAKPMTPFSCYRHPNSRRRRLRI
jgi:hypothetical protein